MKRISTTVLFVLFLAGGVSAYRYSGLEFENRIGEHKTNHYNAIHVDYLPVADGLDEIDALIEVDFCEGAWLGGGFMYSEVEGYLCLYDFRPCDSTLPFQLRFFFCGVLEEETENYLQIDYYCDQGFETFDDKTLILESDILLYGYAIAIRNVIYLGSPYGGGLIFLENVPAGFYDITNPYGSAKLHIGTRHLSDINGDGVCNFSDFNCLVSDWQKPQGKYRGDISGIAGIPDGFVDYYDLWEWTQDWLRGL